MTNEVSGPESQKVVGEDIGTGGVKADSYRASRAGSEHDIPKYCVYIYISIVF